MPTSPLLTTAEAAEILGVSVATVSRWATNDRLPVAMRGPGERGGFFFTPEAVEALRAEREAELRSELAYITPSASSSEETEAAAR